MINGIFEILGVSSPPILPCFRATICRQHVCTLVTRTTPHDAAPPWYWNWGRWGKALSCPRGQGRQVPLWPGKPSFLKEPTPLSSSQVSVCCSRVRIWPQRGKGCGTGTNRWVNQTWADSWSRVLFALRLRLYLPGRWASSQGLRRWGVVQPGRWHAATPDVSLSGALGRDSGGWAPRDGQAGLHESQQLTPLCLYLRLHKVKVWAA